MEKHYKPVPDVEALRYKGTPEQPDIKIFVSHRIDLDSETIDNPLYIPVRCGAVYDERENVTMLGDDTGDNISEKRMSYCELTVQYWAWKNVKADYYGLCHYRRYLSFADKKYDHTDDNNHIVETIIDNDFCMKYGLFEENMVSQIKDYDVISLIPLQLDKLKHIKKSTVYQSLKNNPKVFPMEIVDGFITIVKQYYPDYAEDVNAYFNGYTWRAFNCYIMKKSFFDEYNTMLFHALSILEQKFDFSYLNQEQLRIPGYMGEALWGIYYLHLERLKTAALCEHQLIRVENTDRKVEIYPAFQTNNVPVLLASSNEYVPFLSVLLQSIVCNASEKYNYDVIVIENHITKENQLILKHMVITHANFSLRFISATRYLTNRKLHTALHVTVMTYLRLAMLDIMKHYKKAIYMDCDVVVNTDIAELYNTDLTGYMIGAAVDTVMAGWCNSQDNPQKNYNKNVVGLHREFEYFNAGIIVVNLDEFRQKYTSEELFSIAQSKKWKWFDQDVLNQVCEDHVKFLDNSWNVMSHWHDFDWQLPEFFAPYSIFDAYKRALIEPKAIHYAGRTMPCYVPHVDLGNVFWYYARLSPYYELIISQMISTHLSVGFDPRSGARKLADKLLPKGSRRREFAKVLLPKGSRRWQFCKQVYYIIRPKYRPTKIKDKDEE